MSCHGANISFVDGSTGAIVTLRFQIVKTADAYPGYFDPRWGGEPPSGPEYDLVRDEVQVTEQFEDGDGPVDEYGDTVTTRHRTCTWSECMDRYGTDRMDRVFDQAVDDAEDMDVAAYEEEMDRRVQLRG